MKKRSPLKSCIVALAIILALPGIVFAFIGGVWCFNVHNFVQSAEHTEGTVIELAENNGSFSPVVEYADSQGQQHQYRSTARSNPPAYSVGDKVEILYERGRPDSANINHWVYLYLFPFIFFAIAAVDFMAVLGLSILAMLVSRWSGNRKNGTEQ